MWVAVFQIPVCYFMTHELCAGKYNISGYNRRSKELERAKLMEGDEALLDEELKAAKAENDKAGRICGAIMMSAALIFVVGIFVFKKEFPAELIAVFPAGGILCGIVSVLMKKER